MTAIGPARSGLVGLLLARSRLLSSVLVGVAVGYAWQLVDPSLSSRLLAGWNAGAMLYLVLVGAMMRRADIDDIRRRAASFDESLPVIPLIIVAATAASFAAIVIELVNARSGGRIHGGALAMAAITVAVSWTLSHTVFALHYAHLFYHPSQGDRGHGLQLPGGEDPTYADFLYVAFVIGCATQTADVCFTSRAMRSIGLIHGIVAFVFNTAVLALTVNIAAGLLGQG